MLLYLERVIRDSPSGKGGAPGPGVLLLWPCSFLCAEQGFRSLIWHLCFLAWNHLHSGSTLPRAKSGCFGFSGYKECVLWGWITGFRYCLQSSHRLCDTGQVACPLWDSVAFCEICIKKHIGSLHRHTYMCMHRHTHTCFMHTHTCVHTCITHTSMQNIHVHIHMSLYLYIGLLDYWAVKWSALHKELGSVLAQATV